MLTAPPFQFTVQIPQGTTPGPYKLTALGAITAGQPIWSDSITIDVERPDSPNTLTTDPPGPLGVYVGETFGVDVIGTYDDGSTVNLTNSSQTTLESQSPGIVSVGPGGNLTALAPGSTQIIVNGTLAVPVTVDQPIRVIPASATLTASQTREFSTLITTHPTNAPVTWSISPSGLGSIDANGVYTAPDSISSQQTVTLTATSVADPSLSASATITLSPQAFIHVSPEWSAIYPGQTQQFTAEASNVGTAGLAWSISPAGFGTITNTGLYTAPASIPSLQQVTVTATSIANPSFSASTTTWVSPLPFHLFLFPAGTLVPQASSATINVTELAAEWFPHPVALSTGPLPAGLTASFSPATLTGSGQSTLTLIASASAAPGFYDITVNATDTVVPALTQTQIAGVTIQAASAGGFSFTVTNPVVSAMPGDTAMDSVTAIGFLNTAALSITGLPGGVTASFSPNPLSTGVLTSRLSLSVGATVAPGSYPLVITASDAATGTSQSTNLTLMVLPLVVQEGTLPAGWTNQDVGQPAVAGQATANNGVLQVESTGSGITSAAATDQFQYVFTGIEGNGSITARLLNVQSADAPCGIMMRNTLDPASAYVMLAVSNGTVSLMSRDSYGAQSSFAGSVPDPVQYPVWLQLTRQGNTFSAVWPADGAHWTSINDQYGNPITLSVAMNTNVYAGIIDTAAADGSANTAAFDNAHIRSTGSGFSIAISAL